MLIDYCKSNPCKNSGVCKSERLTYVCLCNGGYEGDNCELKVNECDSKPCQNDGQCVDKDDSYHCKCKAGNQLS